MKQRILSLFCALALVVAMLPPVTASAANLTKLIVGGTTITSSGYWTTNADGTLTPDGASADNYNVYYDGTGTLTLDNATINGTDTIGHVGAGIYAEGDLTIVLEGSSTVTGVQDPNGESQSIRVSGNLTIQGDGSLTAQGADTSNGSSYGIFVIGSFTQQGGSVTAIGGDVSGSYNSEGLYVYGSTVTVERGTLTATGGNTSGSSYGIYARGTVTVNDAIVTATGGSGNASYGLYIDSSSPSVTLSGGSLTARSGSGTDTAVGIYLNNIRSSTGSVTVGNGSTLLTNSVIFRDSSFNENPLAPTGDGSWLIYGQSNQTKPMQGDVTLPDDLTIPSGAEVTIPAGSTLTVPQGKTLTVNGTLNIANQSSLTGDGTLDGSGAFNLTNPDPVISGSDTLTYDGTDQFSKFTLTAPSGTVDVMGQAFNISDSPSLEGWTLDTQVIKDAGNYTVTANHTDGRTIQKQVTVNKATSSISINNTYNPGKTYNGTALANPTESELTLTGAGYNDVTFTWYEGTSPNGTKLDSAPTDTGTYYLVASIPDSNNTTASNATSEAITISPATISITSATVEDKTYDGNQDATVTGVEFTGLVNDESLTSGTDYTATAAFTDKNAGDSKQATVTVELKNGNYTFANSEKTATANATAKISPLAVALSWSTPTSFTYDGTEKSVTASITNAAENDNVTLTYTGNTAATAANEYTATVSGLSGNDASNYTIEGVENLSQKWSIGVASIAGATVELSGTAFTYNGQSQKPTVTVKLNGNTLNANTDYTVDFGGDSINAGTYTVIVTGTGSYSGEASSKPTYTISKADQAALSITSSGPATFGQNYTLTTSGGSGNGAVTFTVTKGTDVATIEGSTLTPTKAGTVTVTAVKAGDNNYNDGTSVSVPIIINKGTYNGTKTATGSVLENWPGEVTLPAIPDGASYGTPTGSDVTDMSITDGVLHYTGGSGVTSGGTYTITVPVTGAANYVDYTITVTLTGTDKQVLTITGVTAQNGTYNGQAQAGYTGTPNAGEYNGPFDVTYSTSDKQAPTNAGTYTVTIAIPDSDPQYVGSTTLKFTIAKKALTVSAPSKTIYVGDTIPDLSTLQATVTGLVGEDTFSGVTLAYEGTPDSNTPGTWAIKPSGGSLTTGNTNNYTVSYVNGTLTVEKKPVSGSGTSGGTTTPSGPSTGGSDGWTEIEDEVDETPSGSTVTVDMNGTTEVPAEVFEAVAGKDVTLELDMGGGVKWEINGQDIPADADLTDLDLGVSLNTSDIPVDVINMVTGEKSTVQLSLAHDGEFGFTLTLTAPVGTENKGLWANLYHYNTTKKQMLFETSAQVDSSGNVALKFTHASEYAIVLDESSHELPFTDTAKGAWYQGAVEYVYRNGIMTGTSATTFEPNAPLSRAMVAQILYNLEGQPTVEGESTFTDASTHWAVDAITWAQETGVVNGYEDNTFRPNRAVTREELAQMLYNYAKVKGYDLTASGDLTAFPDGSKVSSWAKEAMAWANGNQLINGFEDDTLRPGGDSTRAQAASILMNFDVNLAN